MVKFLRTSNQDMYLHLLIIPLCIHSMSTMLSHLPWNLPLSRMEKIRITLQHSCSGYITAS